MAHNAHHTEKPDKEDYRELKNIEKKDDGFVDEKDTKNKKAGSPISPLGGSRAYYFDTEDEHPSFEEVIALQFQDAGKIYWYFYPDYEKEDITPENLLVAYSERGMEIAKVLRKTEKLYEKVRKIDFIRNGIIRKATDRDIQKKRDLRKKAVEAMHTCRELNRKLNIRMKIMRVKYTLDDRKVIFYYTANGRVDFRQLIKDLASTLHRRIEMRQVGVRDGTKIRGGLGMCGRELCCSSYIHDFSPVSISMAKRQNLSLNPKKLSGICGRLFCCLSYEDKLYRELRREYPREGTRLRDNDSGEPVGTVTKVDVIQEKFTAVIKKTRNNGKSGRNGDTEMVTLPMNDLEYREKTWYLKEEKAPAVVDEVDTYIQEKRDKNRKSDNRKKGRSSRKRRSRSSRDRRKRGSKHRNSEINTASKKKNNEMGQKKNTQKGTGKKDGSDRKN